MNSPEPNDEKLERFARALRAAEESRRVFVPPTLDEAILKQARDRFDSARPRPSAFRLRWLSLAGIATVLLVVLLLLPGRKPIVIARGDVNADGSVDILDAMAVAKAVEAKSAGGKLDQNDDGRIDETDVRAVAMASVRLERKPGS